MSGFLRFTLLIAALCAAAVVGYIAGVRNSGPSAPLSDERMSIETHGTSGAGSARSEPPKAAPAPEPGPDEAAAQGAARQNTEDAAGPPTSIDEILRRQQTAQPAPAN